MNAYKTHAEIDASGRIAPYSLSFRKSALLEVPISEQRRQPDERLASWQALMGDVRNLLQSADISEEDIASEVDRIRSAR